MILIYGWPFDSKCVFFQSFSEKNIDNTHDYAFVHISKSLNTWYCVQDISLNGIPKKIKLFVQWREQLTSNIVLVVFLNVSSNIRIWSKIYNLVRSTVPLSKFL